MRQKCLPSYILTHRLRTRVVTRFLSILSIRLNLSEIDDMPSTLTSNAGLKILKPIFLISFLCGCLLGHDTFYSNLQFIILFHASVLKCFATRSGNGYNSRKALKGFGSLLPPYD